MICISGHHLNVFSSVLKPPLFLSDNKCLPRLHMTGPDLHQSKGYSWRCESLQIRIHLQNSNCGGFDKCLCNKSLSGRCNCIAKFIFHHNRSSSKCICSIWLSSVFIPVHLFLSENKDVMIKPTIIKVYKTDVNILNIAAHSRTLLKLAE